MISLLLHAAAGGVLLLTGALYEHLRPGGTADLADRLDLIGRHRANARR